MSLTSLPRNQEAPLTDLSTIFLTSPTVARCKGLNNEQWSNQLLMELKRLTMQDLRLIIGDAYGFFPYEFKDHLGCMMRAKELLMQNFALWEIYKSQHTPRSNESLLLGGSKKKSRKPLIGRNLELQFELELSN